MLRRHPKMNIRYLLPKGGQVKLDIFSLRGGQFSSGQHIDTRHIWCAGPCPRLLAWTHVRCGRRRRGVGRPRPAEAHRAVGCGVTIAAVDWLAAVVAEALWLGDWRQRGRRASSFASRERGPDVPERLRVSWHIV